LGQDAQERIIADALSMMPHVREVIFKNHWLPPKKDVLAYAPFDARYRESAIYGPRTSRNYPTAMPKPYALAVRRLTSYKSPYTMAGYDYGFGVMCRALSMSKRYLQVLSVDYINHLIEDTGYYPNGFYSDTFLSMSSDDLGYARNAFRHLRRISLSCAIESADYKSGHYDKRNLKDSLARILAAAEDLEELAVNFNERNCLWPLAGVLGTHTWPRLQFLYISDKATGEQELTDFIHRHRYTLKSLRLYSIYLDRGNWWTWAENIRSWGLAFSLEQLEIGYLGYFGKENLGTVPECCLKHYISVGQLQCGSAGCRSSSLKNELYLRGLLSNEETIKMFGEP
jgi:hypothetical protein